MKKISLIGLIVVTCLVSTKPLFAQNTDTTKLKRLIFKDLPNDLETVTIAGSRLDDDEQRGATIYRATIKKTNDLQAMSQPTTAEILTQTGEVLVQKSQQGGGSPIIRGFEANKVLIVVDGVRMNNAIFRGGHLQNVLRVDNNALEELEVIYGPNSVLYGSDAFGGVVHLKTKKPQLALPNIKTKLWADAFSRFSTANHEKTSGLGFNIGLKKIAYLANFTFSDFGDLRQGSKKSTSEMDAWDRTFYVQNMNQKDSVFKNKNVNIQTQSGYKQYDLLQKIFFQQTKTVSHTLNFQYSNTSDVFRYDRLALKSANGKPANAEWYYGPETRLMASYSLQLSQKNKLYDKANIVFAYQNLKESRHTRAFNKSNLVSRYENVKVYSINADFSKEFLKNQLNYGLEFNYNFVNSTTNAQNIYTKAIVPATTRYPNGGSQTKNMAFYLTDATKWSKKLTTTAGIRWTIAQLNATFAENTLIRFPFDAAQQRNNALSGNIGLVYKIEPTFTINLLGSTGFRVPNVDDLAKVFDSNAGNIIVPNQNLQPEYTYNAEITINKTLGKRLRMTATTYYTAIENAISTQKFKFNGQDSIVFDGIKSVVTANQNVGRGFIYGYNFNVLMNITANLQLNSTLNYTYGRIKTDTTNYPLDHIAPLFGKTNLIYTKNAIRAELFILYNGSKKLEDFNILGEDNFGDATPSGMPAWATYNARIAYTFPKYMTLQIACENILDTRYRVFASGISASGRNLMATLRLKI